MKTIPVNTDKDGLAPVHKDKNRDLDIIPGQYHQTYLMIICNCNCMYISREDYKGIHFILFIAYVFPRLVSDGNVKINNNHKTNMLLN